MKSQQGFTLIELMIVVAIIAIITTIAVPAYNDYAIRGRLVDGTAALADGKIQMEQYFQDNRTYIGGPAPATTANFTYALSNASATSFTLTASGKGMVSSFKYTIDETNTKQTTALKSGWGSVPAACWITIKGGTC